jgi:hypothetical protein
MNCCLAVNLALRPTIQTALGILRVNPNKDQAVQVIFIRKVV